MAAPGGAEVPPVVNCEPPAVNCQLGASIDRKLSPTVPLAALQRLDQQIARQRARAAELRQALAGNPQLAQAQRTVEERQVERRRLERLQREAEAALADQDARLRNLNSQLYDGSIHDPNVLRALQTELNQAKRRRDELEEKVLEAMVAADEGRAAVAAAEAEQRRLEEAAGGAQRQAVNELGQLRRELAGNLQDRERMVAALPAAARETYERLRTTKGGRAVAEIRGNVCGVCGVAINSSAVQRARGSLTFCDNCGRILHVAH